jgi:nitrate/TMAO reductase-like tetraheme cytochrome c subunit
MFSSSNLTLLLIGVSVLLVVLLAIRADLTRSRDGKILAFFALFLLPSLSMWAGVSRHMDTARSTSFCLSCHSMEDYGKSLYVDDRSYLPASHFQNNRVPRDRACYSCHTNYTMFGTYKDKWRGLNHVYAQYFGPELKRGEIKLYQPFNNRECLHCHAGARSFVEATAHNKTPDLIDKVLTNERSCMSSKCHDLSHDVEALGDATFWKEGNK